MKGAAKNRTMFLSALPSFAVSVVGCVVGDDIELGGRPGNRGGEDGFFLDEDFAKGGHGELLFFALISFSTFYIA